MSKSTFTSLLLTCLIVLSGFSLGHAWESKPATQYDVVIYGGTSAAVTAAVQFVQVVVNGFLGDAASQRPYRGNPRLFRSCNLSIKRDRSTFTLFTHSRKTRPDRIFLFSFF